MTRTRRTQGLERTNRIYTWRDIPYRKTSPGGPRGRGVTICGCYLKDPKNICFLCSHTAAYHIHSISWSSCPWTWSFNGFEAVLYLRKARFSPQLMFTKSVIHVCKSVSKVSQKSLVEQFLFCEPQKLVASFCFSYWEMRGHLWRTGPKMFCFFSPPFLLKIVRSTPPGTINSREMRPLPLTQKNNSKHFKLHFSSSSGFACWSWLPSLTIVYENSWKFGRWRQANVIFERDCTNIKWLTRNPDKIWLLVALHYYTTTSSMFFSRIATFTPPCRVFSPNFLSWQKWEISSCLQMHDSSIHWSGHTSSSLPKKVMPKVDQHNSSSQLSVAFESGDSDSFTEETIYGPASPLDVLLWSLEIAALKKTLTMRIDSIAATAQ